VALSSKLSRIFEAIQNALAGLRKVLFNLVLTFFEELNRQIGSKFSLSCMVSETKEHIVSLIKVFKYVVLPASLVYVVSAFFFGEIAFDSMLFGLLVFVYSNFLPDLPSVFERKRQSGNARDLPWYKKYALLLFAPLFIWALFSGMRCGWRTFETFHNFRSLAVYTSFLFLFGIVFVYPPFTITDLVEVLSVPLYGLAGYLTHLKVDRIL
jgi:hypothetical protein